MRDNGRKKRKYKKLNGRRGKKGNSKKYRENLNVKIITIKREDAAK